MNAALRDRLWNVTAAMLGVLGLYFFVQLTFLPAITSREELFREKQQKLLGLKKTLAIRATLEDEWQARKAFWDAPSLPADSVLNLWVKDLLAYSSSEGLVFSKLEPQGIRKGREGEEVHLSVAFQGDVRRLAGLLYYLREKDPLSRVDAFIMKKEEGLGLYQYELVLGKPVR